MDAVLDPSVLDEDESKDRQFVNALARGLDVLRCFRPGEIYLGNSEMARRTGIPKPSITRLAYTLTKLGYLSYSENHGKYQLGSGVLALSSSMLANLDVRKIARPAMQALAEHSQVSVSIGMRDALSMVYVENCRSSAPVTLRLELGSHIPLATTAMGKALLCALPQDERDDLLDQIRFDAPDKWPRIKAGIDQAMRDYQEFGFCLSVGEWQNDVHAVGVPLLGIERQKHLSLNCGGPAFLLPRERLKNDLGPRLVQLVKNLKTTMGL